MFAFTRDAVVGSLMSRTEASLSESTGTSIAPSPNDQSPLSAVTSPMGLGRVLGPGDAAAAMEVSINLCSINQWKTLLVLHQVLAFDKC